MYLFPKKNREYVFNEGKRLNIGDELEFHIQKKIVIKDIEYFIFTDKGGYRYLVPSRFYGDYGFKENQKVLGWIDKINCMGRIFIEPYHPVYKVGKIYSFDVSSKEVIKENEQTYTRLEIIDVMQKKHYCNVVGDAGAVGEKITCLVEKIKKGKLKLKFHK